MLIKNFLREGQEQVQEIIIEADEYFEFIGVTKNTVTCYSENRKVCR